MRGTTMLAALLLFGCNQFEEPGDEALPCSTEPCEEGLVDDEAPAPELEREADEMGKLGVERDMLESKVQLTSEVLEEATEDLKDAKSAAQKKAAARAKALAAAEHKRASEALARFSRKHGR
jgi:hypothetical protein